MKRIAIVAIACLTANALTGCVTVDPATVRPIYANQAQPYIAAALSTPMDALHAKALGGQPYDWMTYGLALAAGRPSPITVSAEDTAALAALDARLQSAMQAWRAEHKTGDPDKVDWRKRIAMTGDDDAVVRRVEEATSADYWLSRAANANTSNMMFIYMPATTKGGAGYTMPINTYTPVINYEVLYSAGGCVTALRAAAGLPPPSPVPEVVKRLRGFNVGNYQSIFAIEALDDNPNRRHFTGINGCGSLEAAGRFMNLLTNPPVTSSTMGRTL